MPKPGKEPLKRAAREKGPEYRHASLWLDISIVESRPQRHIHEQSLPWVVCWRACSGSELLGVEAGDIWRCHCELGSRVSR